MSWLCTHCGELAEPFWMSRDPNNAATHYSWSGRLHLLPAKDVGTDSGCMPTIFRRCGGKIVSSEEVEREKEFQRMADEAEEAELVEFYGS